MLVRFFKRHLFGKYILATLILGVLGNALILGFYYQYRQKSLGELQSAELAIVGNRLAIPAANLVDQGNLQRSRELLSLFAAYPHVVCSDLFLEAGDRPAVSWPVIGCEPIKRPGRDMDIPLPRIGADARLHLRVDMAVLGRQLRNEFVVLTLLGTIGGLALVLAGIAAFLWFINRPLNLLLSAIQHFERHDEPRHADHDSEDEIGRVIRSYNTMLDREVERVSQLRQAHESIVDSVNYATRIQSALLPTAAQMDAAFSEHAMLWQPRDLIGGDIFWVNRRHGVTTIAIIDCTGHGVPGGLMTMLAISSLERIFTQTGTGTGTGTENLTPAQVLSRLSVLIRDLLNQGDEKTRSNDGMDAAICMLDTEQSTGLFAGARLGLTLLEGSRTRLLKGERASLGYRDTPDAPSFSDIAFSLHDNTRLFLHTDGIIDQIGGPRGIAFGYRRFERIVSQNHELPLADIITELEQNLQAYSLGQSRRDDCTVLALRAGVRSLSVSEPTIRRTGSSNPDQQGTSREQSDVLV